MIDFDYSVASEVGDMDQDSAEEESRGRLLLALDAVSGWRELCGRLTRGLHAERAAAARSPHAAHSPAARALRDRHWYALNCALQVNVYNRK